jgi:hypothetical protein
MKFYELLQSQLPVAAISLLGVWNAVLYHRAPHPLVTYTVARSQQGLSAKLVIKVGHFQQKFGQIF